MTLTDLEQVAYYYYDSLIPDWLPSDQVPEILMPVVNFDQLPQDAVSMVPFEQSQTRNASGFMQAMLLVIAGPGVVTVQQPNATQMVVACAMLLSARQDCGPTYPVADFQHVPNASSSAEGYEILAPFSDPGSQPSEEDVQQLESALGDLQSLTQHKLDTFMALPPDEKAAWLEGNWDQLSSGELTLDDMP